jgi:thioredoxin-like negative regulator of GroEL
MLWFLSGVMFVLAVTAVAWWMSGYDLKLSGDNTRADYVRRGLRVAFTLVLMVILLELPKGQMAGPIAVVISFALALIWVFCLTECFSRGFQVLTGIASSHREFDPHEHVRELERLAWLLSNGPRDEALRLAETLKTTSNANILAVEALLERAGIPQENSKKVTPLLEASRQLRQGKLTEAETILKSLLAENPSNVDAALLLMRLYAQDLHQSDQAMEVLRKLEQQPYISPSHIEYASRSIHEWGRKKPAPEAEVIPESVEELIAAGYLGTAIEILEQAAMEQLDNFEAQLKLAEAYGLHSSDPVLAEKIIKKIGNNPAFSAEQIHLAQTKLQEWR